MPISVITDFENLPFYRLHHKTKPTDKIASNGVKYLTYADYVKFLWDFDKEREVLKGSFDKYIANDKSKRTSCR